SRTRAAHRGALVAPRAPALAPQRAAAGGDHRQPVRTAPERRAHSRRAPAHARDPELPRVGRGPVHVDRARQRAQARAASPWLVDAAPTRARPGARMTSRRAYDVIVIGAGPN